ncbi:MAG: ankyrin repeat domain-containing protein [Chlamydiales bacterium]
MYINNLLSNRAQNPETEKEAFNYAKFSVINLIALAALGLGAVTIWSASSTALFTVALAAEIGGSGAFLYTNYKVIRLFREEMNPVTTVIPSDKPSSDPQTVSTDLAPIDPAPIDPAPIDPAPIDPAPAVPQLEPNEPRSSITEPAKESRGPSSVNSTYLNVVESVNHFFGISPQTKLLEPSLQRAIYSGDLESLKTMLETVDLNSKLPNGELPLHFAVREGQVEAVKILVEGGANSLEKDFQGLTAVDHAFLQNNKEALIALFGPKVQENFASAIDSQNAPLTRMALRDIENIANKISSEEAKQQYNSLQQAVLLGHSNRVRELLEKGGDIHIVTGYQSLSLLHLAAIGNSPEAPAIIDLLIKNGVDVNIEDVSGKTSASYAAVNPTGDALGRLIKQGANLMQKDNSNVTPLALLGASAQQNDPLNLPKSHALLFAATVMQVAGSMAIQSGLIGQEEHLMIMITSLSTIGVLGLIGNFSEFYIHLQNIDKTWKKALAWFGYLFVEAVPIVGTPFMLWRLYNVTKSAFAGIKVAYNNARYRTFKAARNAIFYTTNAGASINKIWLRYQYDYEVFANGYYWIKIITASNEEEQFKAYENYYAFLRNRYGVSLDGKDPITEVDPSELIGLSPIDRLTKEELNPSYVPHALMMIDPTFTIEQLREQGAALYTKTYRNLMLHHVHPDKINAKNAELAAINLGLAKEILDNWVKENT